MTIRLRTKIIASFSVIMALLSILGLMAYHNRDLLFRGMLTLEDKINELNLISEIRLNIDRSVMPPNDYLITGDVGEKARFIEIAGVVDKDLERLSAMYDGGHAGFDKRAVEEFELLKKKAAAIFAIKDPVGSAKGARQMEEMDSLASDIIKNHLDKGFEAVNREAVAETLRAGVTRKRVDMLLYAGGALSLITLFAVIAYLSRSILRPILIFKEGAFTVGQGNLDHRIDVRDGLEMNLLAAEFNKMTEKLRESYAGLEKKVEERTKDLNEVNVKLQELSITDGLTGAYNHRYFYGKLSEELSRAQRYGRPLSVIMTDIDHFKRYNDAHGHMEGDNVLKGVASCIRENVRGQDMVARYGGEEFSVILPETGKKEAAATAERIRQCMLAQPFPNEDTQPGGSLTISLGVSSFPDDAEDPKDLMKKADDALYRAKENGKNRVEAA